MNGASEDIHVMNLARCQPAEKSEKRFQGVEKNLLGQWLNFKLFGIAYLVGKIKFKLLFQGSIR